MNLKEINSFCEKVGNNRFLTQAAGGNVSLKVGNSIYVKASGTWLAHANKQNIFAKLDYELIKSRIENRILSIPEAAIEDKSSKPSIETLMHVIMPKSIVVHLHAITPLAILVRKDADRILKEIFRDRKDFAFIEYIRPGEDLARAFINLEDINNIRIIFLKNHGIVINADSLEEIESLLNEVTTSISHFLSSRTKTSLVLKRYEISGYQQMDMLGLEHFFTVKENFFKIQKKWALTPDQLVFLGNTPFFVNSIIDAKKTINAASPKFIFVYEHGLFFKSDINQTEHAQLVCFMDILSMQDELDNLETLCDAQINELIEMESEKYRIKNAL